jgi:D-alanyl-lipoteichoic acid acyltransferase DltB (MBOAT superfamily)
MNFNSYAFAVFFVIVYTLYLSLDHKRQNRMLLLASYVFYGFWDWRFLGLILASTLTDYFCALAIDKRAQKAQRKPFVVLSLVINLTILGFFKYFNFFIDNAIAFFGLFGLELSQPTLRIILPVGISFYTFQTISYTVDVYRKQCRVTRDFLDYALYVSFFPQLVAGPIERAKNLLPQISSPRSITWDQIREGLLLIFWGTIKKVVIADNLGTLISLTVNPFLENRAPGSGALVLAGSYAFMFQLYCDFSAYSDIARGTAKLMGIEIMVNFRSPYLASNIQEVWSRWHISLTTWIRDYLYFPLILAKFKWLKKKHLGPRTVTLVTFVIMGLWHGAAWNFVLWGVYNGLLLIIYSSLQPHIRPLRGPKPKPVALLLKGLSLIGTFHLLLAGVIFFRAGSFHEIVFSFQQIIANFALSQEAVQVFLRTMFYVAPLLIIEALQYRKDDLSSLARFPALVRYGFFYAGLYLLVLHGTRGGAFIYFQF